MTKKKIKLSPLAKLKNRIKELESKLVRSEGEVEYYRGKYDGVKNQVEDIKDSNNSFCRTMEGRSIPIAEERDWLRNLVELVVVDKSKIDNLQKQKELSFKQRGGLY